MSMKRIITVFVAICFVLVFCSCVNHNNKVNTNVDIVSVENSLALSHTLQKAIKECVNYLSEIGVKMGKDEKLLIIFFTKEKNDDYYLYTLAQPTYSKEFVKGYTYLDGYTVVLYGDTENNIWNQGLLDLDKFINYSDTIPCFMDFNVFPDGHYDPYGIKYKIINSDSLLVVYKGMI